MVMKQILKEFTDKEITDMMKCFTPYMFEPEKDDVSSISSSSSEVEDEDENDSESKTNLEKSSRVGNLEWCKCGEVKKLMR